MTTRILIADDHPIVLAGIRDVLAGELDLEIVGGADDPDPATGGDHRLQHARG
nr:hypothetical protein [Stenotrophomonas pavanii]